MNTSVRGSSLKSRISVGQSKASERTTSTESRLQSATIKKKTQLTNNNLKTLNNSLLTDKKDKNKLMNTHAINNTTNRNGVSKNKIRTESPSPAKAKLNLTLTQSSSKMKPFIMPNTARRNKISIVNEVLDGEMSKVLGNSNKSFTKTGKLNMCLSIFSRW